MIYNYKNIMKQFIKKPSVIISVVIFAAVIFGGYWFFLRPEPPSYETVIAQKGDIIQEVSVTGRVKPAQSVNLAFERSGKVAEVFIKVGDKVKAGQALIALDNSELSSQLKQAESSLESARAKLAELKRGARPEEIAIAETAVANAEKSLADAETNLENTREKADGDLANLYGSVKNILNDAYIKADDAANKQTDEMFSNDLTTSPQLSFLVTSQQVEIDAEWRRVLANGALSSFQSELSVLSDEPVKLDAAMVNAENHLKTVKDFLEDLSEALNFSAGLSASTLASYKGYVNTGRTNNQTALTNIGSQKQTIAAQKITNQNNISSAESKVNDAQNALAAARNELALKKAGAAEEQITAQEAVVRQGEANVQNFKVQISKTVLYSPINGVITKREDAKIGEIVVANANVLSVISEAKYEIEANVPEADIAKIKIGDEAKVTLDAYGNDVVFKAAVAEIEPAETILEGVATYKTTFQFLKDDGRVKAGMTANIDILAGRRENVIKIPQRALTAKNGDKYARVLADGEIKEVEVKTGLRGSDGWVEIIEGLNEGDVVVLSVK